MDLRPVITIIFLLATASSGAQPEALKAKTGEQKIIEFHRYSQKILPRDPLPRLTIFDSGRVVVYFPAYMRRAGTHETTIPDTELTRIIQALVNLGIDSMARDVVAQARERASIAQKSPGTLYYSSDATITTIQLTVLDPSATGKALSNTVFWKNLQDDANRFPQVDGLQKLAEAERLLLDFVDTVDVRQVDSATRLEALRP